MLRSDRDMFTAVVYTPGHETSKASQEVFTLLLTSQDVKPSFPACRSFLSFFMKCNAIDVLSLRN